MRNDFALRPGFGVDSPGMLQSIFCATNQGILVTDLQHRSLACNAQFGDLFRLDAQLAVRSEPEQLRSQVYPILDDPEGWREQLEAIYANPQLRYEDELRLHGGSERVLRRFTAPLYDASRRIVGRLWTFFDITRYVKSEISTCVTVGDLTIQLETRSARVGKNAIALTPYEFNLLSYLAARPNEPVSRSVVFRQVWGYDINFNTNSLDVMVYRLRKKIEEDADHPKRLLTVRGVGYLLSDGMRCRSSHVHGSSSS